MVKHHIEKKFGVEYSRGGARLLLKRLGFSWKKARPTHPKAASKRQQKQFMKETTKIVDEFVAKGYKVMTMDASSFELSQKTPSHGWRRRGRRVTVQATLSRKKTTVFGVLGEDTFFFRFYKKANSKTVRRFLRQVHKKFEKVLIILDNASYHKSKKVKELLEEFEGDIQFVFLPPYTPELNPIEIQWRLLKRALSDKLFLEISELKKSIRRLVRRKEVMPVQMPQYLIT